MRSSTGAEGGTSGWAIVLGLAVSGGFVAQAPGAPAHGWAPKFTRVDLGGGHTLRVLTVEGRQRGERLGAGMVCWRSRAGGPLGVLIAAPTFDDHVRVGGRLFWLNPSVGGGWAVEEAFLGGVPARGKLGLAMASTGDFNGDGAPEIALGSPYSSGTLYRAGAVSILPWQDDPSAPHARILRSAVARAHFGTALDAVGDVNRDGFDDLVVGAPVMSGEWDEEGAAFLFLGSADGLATNSVWIAWGGQRGMRLGEEIRTAGDVNADGFADVLVAAPRWGEGLPGHGEVRLYLGCAEGLQSEPSWVYRGPGPYAKAGRGLLGGVDFNRDGFADALVGLPGANAPGGIAGMGQVHFFLGNTNGFASEPDWTWEGTLTGDGFGDALCVVGDMNGDGLAELAVGAPFTPIVGRHQGILRIFSGSPDGFSNAPLLQVVGGLPHGRYGFQLSALGDVDGDGLADLGVGSPDFPTHSQTDGRCDILFGSRGLGGRPLILEALRTPAFRAPVTNTLLGAVLEVRRTPLSAVSAGRLAWRASDWTLVLIVTGAMSMLYLAWKSARGKLERIRHRLHDFVGSELSQLDNQDPRMRRVTDELRALIWAFKQERPTVPGLVSQLADWAWEYASERRLELRLELPGPEVGVARVGSGVAELAHATVRVAMSNVVQHSNATGAVLRIEVTEEQMKVEVEDNGVGLPEDVLKDRHYEWMGSQGLRGLRRRVEGCNGSLSVENLPGHGTRLTVCLPIARPDAAPWNVLARKNRNPGRWRDPVRVGSTQDPTGQGSMMP